MMVESKIRLFNTFSRKKEHFTPLEEGVVKLYTCGPTVYGFAHIGNFRTYVFQDLLRRWLEYRGFKVVQAMNITDVDDKTIAGAIRERVSLKEYTERYVTAFFRDLERLNILAAEFYPRATEHVDEIVALVAELLKKGYAYKAEDGSIYYAISKFKEYGKLSGFKIDELKPGARVKVDSYSKERARDFALWKAWDEADGDVYWVTELGKGRPGWHVECSVMATKYLGETLDIHSGGEDLIFPHHENEIAQSEAASGKRFCRYWLHSKFLVVEGQRMAKSAGNFYTVDDLVNMGYEPNAIRYLLLSTHYRQQLNFTIKGLDAAEKTVQRLLNFLYRLETAGGKPSGGKLTALMKKVVSRFEEALDDDLDISAALAALFTFVRKVNLMVDRDAVSSDEAKAVHNLLMNFNRVLGLVYAAETTGKTLPEEVEAQIKKREAARKRGDWKTADEIRAKLLTQGWVLEDVPGGVNVYSVEKKVKAVSLRF